MFHLPLPVNRMTQPPPAPAESSTLKAPRSKLSSSTTMYLIVVIPALAFTARHTKSDESALIMTNHAQIAYTTRMAAPDNVSCSFGISVSNAKLASKVVSSSLPSQSTVQSSAALAWRAEFSAAAWLMVQLERATSSRAMRGLSISASKRKRQKGRPKQSLSIAFRALKQ